MGFVRATGSTRCLFQSIQRGCIHVDSYTTHACSVQTYLRVSFPPRNTSSADTTGSSFVAVYQLCSRFCWRTGISVSLHRNRMIVSVICDGNLLGKAFASKWRQNESWKSKEHFKKRLAHLLQLSWRKPCSCRRWGHHNGSRRPRRSRSGKSSVVGRKTP